jgi:uncharacterized repeat protein (TIGR01451 family)
VKTKRGTFNVRRARLGLLLIIFDVLVFSSSLLMKNEVSALCGTGVGIRKDGPARAYLNETIEYAITVYNLGDYWIRNATIPDLFPNGTSKSWNVPDLAPLGQLGDSFNISNVLYTIQDNMFHGNPAYIINHAEVTGYSDTQGLSAAVSALTNYVTRAR